MSEPDKIHLRRQILEWRDEHITNIHRDLNHEMNMLLIDIDKKLEEIPFLKVFSTDSYFKKNIEPIYIEWVENETTILIQAAQKDLNTIYQHAIDHKSKQNDLNYKDTKDSIIAAATALLSTSGAVIATPTVMSLSLTAVPATGVLAS